MHITHIETESLWQEDSTNYWFEVNGESYGVNVFYDVPFEPEFWTLIDNKSEEVKGDTSKLLDLLTPYVQDIRFKEWQDRRQYMTLDAIGADIGMNAKDIHETATHGWLYDDGMWIVDLGNDKAWSLVEREDYTGPLHMIERWVFNDTRAL